MVNFEQDVRRPRPTCFLADSEKFRADTCEPLRAAVGRNELDFNALARCAYPGHRLPPQTLEGVMSVGYWDARGRSRFSHYCYELTNMSPSEYLNFCRIEKACRIIASNLKASITEVAIECGFSSSQYFATVLRKHTRST